MQDLYIVDQRIKCLFDTETGEIFDIEQLERLEMERAEIFDELYKERNNLLGGIAALKEEENRLKERRQNLTATVERIEKWISHSLEGQNYEPESKLYKISFRKSKETECYDLDALLEYDFAGKYYKVGKPEANKTEIKKAIESGIEIPGCRINEKLNMSIK